MCRSELRRPVQPHHQMNFERSEQLKPILDDLEANDQNLFYGLQQVKLGQEYSPSTVFAVFEAFREQLTERAKKIFSEIQRVIAGTYIEDFDNLTEALKTEWTGRLELMASVASPDRGWILNLCRLCLDQLHCQSI
jgi:hypothetical protein